MGAVKSHTGKVVDCCTSLHCLRSDDGKLSCTFDSIRPMLQI